MALAAPPDHCNSQDPISSSHLPIPVKLRIFMYQMAYQSVYEQNDTGYQLSMRGWQNLLL